MTPVRRILLGAVAAAALLPAGAQAATFCVHAPAGCSGTVPSPDTVQKAINDAVSNADDRDTIRVGVGTFDETFVVGAGNKVDIIGSGRAATTFRVQSEIDLADQSSSLRDLRVELKAGSDAPAVLVRGGLMERVTVSAPGPYETGQIQRVVTVLPPSGTTLRDLDVTTRLASGHYGVDTFATSGTVLKDSTIQAGHGIAGNGFTVRRSTLSATTHGVLTYGSTVVDSTVIRLLRPANGENAEGIGIGSAADGAPTTAFVRGVTIHGSGPFSRGVQVFASGSSVTANVRSTVITNVGHALTAFKNTGAATPSIPKVVAEHCNLDATTVLNQGGAGAIDVKPSCFLADPLFANAAAGDFRLKAGSPNIERGDPGALAPGESDKDRLGGDRTVDGNGDATKRRDVGAHEFLNVAPQVTARATSPVGIDQPAELVAEATDATPGDTLTYEWVFDDGSENAKGATVSHAFTTPGTHTAGVTVTDAQGATGTAKVTIEVVGRTTENGLEGFDSTPAEAPVAPGTCVEDSVGTGQADCLLGGSGEDTLSGAEGADRLRGLGGADVLLGEDGDDTLDGGAGDDLLDGGPGKDRLDGGAGADRLKGAEGDDTLQGGAGNDEIAGGKGKDKVTAGAGADTIDVRDGAKDTVDCGAGRDKVSADKADKLVGCERVTVRRGR